MGFVVARLFLLFRFFAGRTCATTGWKIELTSPLRPRHSAPTHKHTKTTPASILHPHQATPYPMLPSSRVAISRAGGSRLVANLGRHSLPTPSRHQLRHSSLLTSKLPADGTWTLCRAFWPLHTPFLCVQGWLPLFLPPSRPLLHPGSVPPIDLCTFGEALLVFKPGPE